MEKSFIQESIDLLKTLPPHTEDMDPQLSLVPSRLLAALERLSAVVDQAEAQFKAGDTHATFNKEFIRNIR